MKIMTSYFYQIRFFTPNMIPLSTAKWDPKWFHQGRGQAYQWKDKRGVWNGLRAEPFVPGASCDGLCRGPQFCQEHDPAYCAFLRCYRGQLNRLDFTHILDQIDKVGKRIQEMEGFQEEPVVVLIVHEATSNPCSERRIIQQWFRDNGYPIEEFDHSKI